ncbi:MFS transporter [Saccharopolyspora phatthalungensis]|uniref:Putative proline/betaine transporter n=1 Tax=Saccharopolyspora phatthalungensis TaxID=664693 RepID=A0A840QI06_9PSEU|nr:MFS transporter [Saccharopolyspora phatthalungensis]MBB5159847.1 MHS family proline/betaine transporter-like MFS transporter [Saccharopolyspora phatthalungensis]
MSTTAEIPARTLRRTTLAAAIGNTVETYDYAVYGFLATVLAKVFFPSSSPGAALLSSFAVFGSAFLARPAGALVFGPLADRLGRRPALVASLLLMAGVSMAIGLLPPTASIGIAAPILLVLLRFGQGLSAGGEYTTALIYVAEFAPPRRRGELSSHVQVGSLAGLLLGAVVVLSLNAALTAEQMQAWGWRVPFLLALPVAGIGLYLRSRLGETPEFVATRSRVSEDTKLSAQWPRMLLIVGVSVLHVVGFYMVYTYVQNYLIQLHLSPVTATSVIAFALLVGLFLVVAGGRACDRKGRAPVLLATSIAVLVLTYPLFAVMASASSLWLVVCCTVLLSAGPAFYSGVAPITYIQLVPVRVRGSVVAVSYNVAVAVLGGSAVFVCQALVEITGDNRSPAYLLLAAAAVSAIAAFALARRSAPYLDSSPSTEPLSAEASS